MITWLINNRQLLAIYECFKFSRRSHSPSLHYYNIQRKLNPPFWGIFIVPG